MLDVSLSPRRIAASAEVTQLGELPLLCPDDPWSRWFEQHRGKAPAFFAANFSDSGTLQRATPEGRGVSIGRATMTRALMESGHLVALFPERLRARYAHYLVYPDRSRKHSGFMAFRQWLTEEAAAFRDDEEAAQPRVVATSGAKPSAHARPRKRIALARSHYADRAAKTGSASGIRHYARSMRAA